MPFGSFLPFNPVKKPVRKQMFGAGLNPSDFDQNDLTLRSREEDRKRQAAEDAAAQPPSLVDAYSKMSGNRPQRLAYQEAVESGPEQIKRGKWAKLGAALAAGGSALGGTKAPDAVNMALSSYYEPQRRSDEYHEKRVKGLADLANMEESDMQEKLKVLEYQNKDWYAQRAEKRAGEDQVMQANESTARVDNIRDEMRKRNTDEWDEEGTGLHWKMTPDGKLTATKRGRTTTEEAAAQKAITTAKEEALEPGRKAGDDRRSAADKASDERQAASSLANVNAAQAGQTARTTQTNATKANIASQKLRESAQTSTGAMRQQKLDLAAAINSDPSLMSYDLNSMIEEKSGIFKVIDNAPTLGFGGDPDDVVAIKGKLREILARGGKPAAATTPAAIDNRRWLPDPKDPSNSIKNPNFGKPMGGG